jgi:shikimate dehydrogenase
MGAVNCAVRRGDGFIGENTDGKGFLQSLRTVTDPKDKTVVMFGAGGAARAIGVELAFAGAKRIIVVNRSDARGRALVDLLNAKTRIAAELVGTTKAYRLPDEADILVNATSIGLYPDVEGRINLDTASLRPGLVVADVITNPPRSPLIRDAEARGCVTLDGLGMVVNQGVIGIKYWTGVDVDAGVMRRTLEDLFKA